MTVGRFAPSPSGRMHLGNVSCFLLAWLSAKSAGGRIVLRIEDLDTARCTREKADLLMDDLLWLGLDWDEGPGVGGPDGPYWQSQRGDRYARALDRLRETGRVYPCFCTRAELRAASAPHREDGQTVYPGTCRRLTGEERAARARIRRPALRIAVPDRETAFTDGHLGPYREDLARESGDFLLRRSDGLYAYQLAVVVDDAAMGITEVVRGADLLSSTPRQLWLYELLGLDPPRFSHVPLLLGSDGRRLSKRDGLPGLGDLRGRMAPEEVLGRLARLMGFWPSGAPARPQELAEAFDWSKVPREDVRLPDGLF